MSHQASSSSFYVIVSQDELRRALLICSLRIDEGSSYDIIRQSPLIGWSYKKEKKNGRIATIIHFLKP